MKKYPALLLAGALLLSSGLSAASFEGKVTMKMTGSRSGGSVPPLLNYSLKEGFFRIDMQADKGPPVAMIMDLTKQEMILLMVQQKMYMVQPIPRPEAQGNGAGSGAPANPADVSFDKTGESDTILGYPCVKYVSKYKDSTSEIWITDQLGTFMGFGSGGGPMGRSRSASSSQPWEKMLVGKNFFPLRIVTHGTDGKESFRLEVTSVEKQSLPDSFFAPPEGFQKFDVGNMMRGMMPGGMPSGGRPPGSG